MSVAFSSDGRQLAAALGDSTVHVWSLQPDNTFGKPQILTDFKNPVFSLVFSPDSRHLDAWSPDGTTSILTQFDLVGEENVASKIMFLQLLARDGKDILNKSHLLNIFTTFNSNAQQYLQTTYDLPTQSLLTRILTAPKTWSQNLLNWWRGQ